MGILEIILFGFIGVTTALGASSLFTKPRR